MDFKKLKLKGINLPKGNPEAVAASMKSFKAINWKAVSGKYFTAQASEDLNKFLEQMPQNSGKTMLIIAGVAWATAGALGLFTTVQIQKLTELRAKLQEASALQPVVPVIKDVPVDAAEVKNFVDKIRETYGGLDIREQGSSIVITADSTGAFGQFREAIGHIQNGGSGWRVNIDRLCVGRECERNPLAAALKINKVTVENPV